MAPVALTLTQWCCSQPVPSLEVNIIYCVKSNHELKLSEQSQSASKNWFKCANSACDVPWISPDFSNKMRGLATNPQICHCLAPPRTMTSVFPGDIPMYRRGMDPGRACSKVRIGLFSRQPVTRWEGMASNCARAGSGGTPGRNYSLRGWPGMGMGSPERWWSHHSWKCSRNGWRQRLVLWFSWHRIIEYST